MNSESNTNLESVNSLDEILNSINLTENKNNENDKNKENKENIENEENEKVQRNIKKDIELFSDDIDRKIGKYLIDELEKKQSYIDELEEVIKFQEKEISDLKNKLDTLNKLELLAKLKININDKLDQTNILINEKELEKSPKSQNINLTRNKEIFEHNSEISYPSNNPDLVLNSSSKLKVKSIKKEDEEIRYNGITILEKPSNESKIRIEMDYETENGDKSDILKQRRRARKI